MLYILIFGCTIPFAFVIFYAGLQTVDKEKIEAAFVDFATSCDVAFKIYYNSAFHSKS